MANFGRVKGKREKSLSSLSSLGVLNQLFQGILFERYQNLKPEIDPVDYSSGLFKQNLHSDFWLI